MWQSRNRIGQTEPGPGQGVSALVGHKLLVKAVSPMTSPVRNALLTDTVPSNQPYPAGSLVGQDFSCRDHSSRLLPAVKLTPGKLVPAINPMGHSFPQGMRHLVLQFQQDLRLSSLAFHWLVY